MNWVILWLIVLIVAAVVEILSVQLLAVWFCVGSLAAMIAAAFKLSIEWQLILFFVVSIILIFSTRPVVKKILTPKLQRTNADRFIGKECIVISDIDNIEGTGTVKISGQIWTARSSDDNKIIKTGQKVTVREIQGVKMIVEEVILES